MMDVDPQQPQQYTILRIKRKRTDEPLDALVVENRARKKRSPRGLNIFQFAQTVEQDAWEDEKRRKDLQEQISRLAKETSNNPVEAPPSTLPKAEQKPPPPIGCQPKDDPSRRYTIVKQDESGNERPRLPTSPPKVISHKDLPPKQTDFKMYDAILYGDGGTPAPTFDSDMDKFLPMLTDYLKIHDMSPPGFPSAATSAAEPSVPIPESKSQGDDYVWDVFYHRPTTLGEWNAAIANIGTLTGLPPSTTDPNESDSDTEPEDEADEDSNEEEYYKNDYPEEENSSSDDSDSSDMFHERSDYEEMLEEDSFDEREWR